MTNSERCQYALAVSMRLHNYLQDPIFNFYFIRRSPLLRLASDNVMAGEAIPWYNAYPNPRNDKPVVVTRNEVLAWPKNGQKPGVDFLLIDLRRTDHEVRLSRCSPAHAKGPSREG